MIKKTIQPFPCDGSKAVQRNGDAGPTSRSTQRHKGEKGVKQEDWKKSWDPLKVEKAKETGTGAVE